MSLPGTTSQGSFQFSTIGKQPSLLSRMTLPDSNAPPNLDADAAPSPPPASPNPQHRTSSLGRLAGLMSPGNRTTALPETPVSAVSQSSKTAVASSSASAPVTGIFNLSPEIFKTAPKSLVPPTPSPSTPTSFYFRQSAIGASLNVVADEPSAVFSPSAAAASSSQPPRAPVASAAKHQAVSSTEEMQADAPSRPPEPIPPLRASVPAASSTAIPTESARLAEELREHRADLDDIRRIRERVCDESQGFRHRCQEIEHALERQKAQMERLVAACEELFDKEERIHEHREQRLVADEARLAALQDEERKREAELAAAEEQARAEAEEKRHREEERVKAEEQARAEAEAKRRQEEEEMRAEEQRKREEEAERRAAEAAQQARLAEAERQKREAEEAGAKAEKYARLQAETKKRKEEEAKKREQEETKKREEEKAKRCEEDEAKRRAEENAKAKAAADEKQRKVEQARAEAQEQEQARFAMEEEKRKQDKERARRRTEDKKRQELDARAKAAREAESLERETEERAKAAEKEARLDTATEPLQSVVASSRIAANGVSPSPEVAVALATVSPSPEVAVALATVTPSRDLPKMLGSPSTQAVSFQGSPSGALHGSLTYPQDDIRTQVTATPYLQVRQSALQSDSGFAAMAGPPLTATGDSQVLVDTGGEAATRMLSTVALQSESTGLPPVEQNMSPTGSSRINRIRYTQSPAASAEERQPMHSSQEISTAQRNPVQMSSVRSDLTPTTPQVGSTPTNGKGKKKKKNAVAVKPEPSLSPPGRAAPAPPPPVAQTRTTRAVAHSLPPKGEQASKTREQTRTNAGGDRSAYSPPTPNAQNSTAPQAAFAVSEASRNSSMSANQSTPTGFDGYARDTPLADRLNHVPAYGGLYGDDGMVASVRDDSPHRGHGPPPEIEGRMGHYSPPPTLLRERRYPPSPVRSDQRYYSPSNSPRREPLSPGRKRLRDDDRDLPPARRPRYNDDRVQRFVTPPPYARRSPSPRLLPPPRPRGDSRRLPSPPPRLLPPPRPQGDSYRPNTRDVGGRSPPPPWAHRLVDPPPSYSTVISSDVPREPRRMEPRMDELPRHAAASGSRSASSYKFATSPPLQPEPALMARLTDAAPARSAQGSAYDEPALLSRMSDAPPRSTAPRAKTGRAPAEEQQRRGKAPNRAQPPKKGYGGNSDLASRLAPAAAKGSLESRFSQTRAGPGSSFW